MWRLSVPTISFSIWLAVWCLCVFCELQSTGVNCLDSAIAMSWRACITALRWHTARSSSVIKEHHRTSCSPREWTVWILLYMWWVEERVSQHRDDTRHVHHRSSRNVTGRVAVHGTELFRLCYTSDELKSMYHDVEMTHSTFIIGHQGMSQDELQSTGVNCFDSATHVMSWRACITVLRWHTARSSSVIKEHHKTSCSPREWTVWILLHMWWVEERVSQRWNDTQHIHHRSSRNITGQVAVHGSELFGFCYCNELKSVYHGAEMTHGTFIIGHQGTSQDELQSTGLNCFDYAIHLMSWRARRVAVHGSELFRFCYTCDELKSVYDGIEMTHSTFIIGHQETSQDELQSTGVNCLDSATRDELKSMYHGVEMTHSTFIFGHQGTSQDEWTVWILLQRVSQRWDDTQHVHHRSSRNVTRWVAVHGSELFGFCYTCPANEQSSGFARGLKRVKRKMQHSKSSVSLMFCGNALGEYLPPMVVYRAQNIYTEWTCGGPTGCIYECTKSGWFDSRCFERWFREIFLPHANAKDGKKVLLGDNLASHFTPEVIQAAVDNNIEFVCLIPNSTHILQPLDVAVFRSVKVEWRRIMEAWRKEARIKGSIPK